VGHAADAARLPGADHRAALAVTVVAAVAAAFRLVAPRLVVPRPVAYWAGPAGDASG
jgi:hypothetical protein